MRSILFVLLLGFVGQILTSAQVAKPPPSIRLVGALEFAFGTGTMFVPVMLLVFTPLGILGHELATLLGVLGAIGVAWDTLAIQLLKGKSWARSVFVVLSMIRIPVLVGLPFSFANLWLFTIRVFVLTGIPVSFLTLYVLSRDSAAKAFFGRRE